MNHMIRPSKTKKVKAKDVPKSWTELLDLLSDGDTRVVVEQDGVLVAAIVSKQDWESLKRSDELRIRALEAVKRMSEAFADVPDEELERQVSKALAEVREENRQRSAGSAGV